MFCTKCGKTIDDNAPFCSYCGAPTGKSAEPVTNGAAQEIYPQQTAPQQAAPQAPQYGAPQAPQYGAPQAPQYGAPQAPQYGNPNSAGAVLKLAPNIVNWIKIGLLGVIAIVSLLVLIGSIVTLASVGAMFSGSLSGIYSAATSLYGAMVMVRVTAIICFVFCVVGVAFKFLANQNWNLIFICAALGVLIFVFNFVLFSEAVIFAGIMLIISASAMLSVIARAVIKDILPIFKR